jgi:hypothetical protein
VIGCTIAADLVDRAFSMASVHVIEQTRDIAAEAVRFVLGGRRGRP